MPIKMTELTDEEYKERTITEADRVEEDCVVSGKSQLNTADIWHYWHFGLGIPATALAALAAADLFDGTPLSQLLATAAACVFAISTFLNPSQKSSAHQVAGNQYLALAKKTRRFKEIDIPSGSDRSELREQLA